MLESMGLPLPSEGVLVAAAIIAGSHAEPSLAGLILAAAAGAILGDNIAYWVGRRAGAPLLARYGHRLHLDAPRQRLGRYLFLRYGGRIVFIARFVSGLRTVAALLAGVNRMPAGRFFVANALGAVVWASVVGSLAYAFGARLHDLSRPLLIAGSLIAVGVAVGLAVLLNRQEQRLQAEADRALLEPEG